MLEGRAPWTAQQVANLKRWQACEWVHPYICPSPQHPGHVLTPTEEGWHCSRCEYTQSWAHPSSLSGLPPNLMQGLDPPSKKTASAAVDGNVASHPAFGYACTIDGAIQVNTISTTRRAAMVNGLVTIFGVQVTYRVTDEWIARSWEDKSTRARKTHKIVKVRITAQEGE